MEAAAEEARQSTGRCYVTRHVHVEYQPAQSEAQPQPQANQQAQRGETEAARDVSAHQPSHASSYRGVRWRYGRWKARVKHNGRDVYLGTFDDAMEAARAYDRKAREVLGDEVAHAGWGMCGGSALVA